jgi:lysozyme family protein
MSEYFRRSWRKLKEVEGGYVDDPNDSGGKTKYGVTESLARRHGYVGAMSELDEPRALAIAKVEFWDPLRLDKVADCSWRTANEIFDSAYNMGRARVASWLQRCLNLLNLRGHLFPDLVEDGNYGPATLAALATFLDARPDGEIVLLRMLNSLQGAFYIELAARREKDEAFIYGWFRHRVV